MDDDYFSYSYEPIHHDEVRLVKFKHDSDRISGVLKTFPLGGPIPPYNALSYSWLSESPATNATEECHVLETKQGPLRVLDTMHSFFRVLLLKGAESDDLWWWIDSICINLRDVEERSQQVQLMGQIYRNAHAVIIWLGEELDHTDRAVDFIQLLNKTVRQQTYRPGSDEIRRIFQQDHYQPHWAALTSFFQRQWWSRIWTVQEYAMNTNASFWWGMRSFSRFAVEGALIGADQCTSVAFKGTPAFRHGFSRRRVQVLYKKGQDETNKLHISLVALAAYTSCFEATDDRDRLYGIKALASDTCFLDVDYSESVEDTYLRFAKAFIKHYKSLDIICFASIYSSLPGSVLPSWAPDWRARIDPLSVPLMVSQSAKPHIGNLRPFALTVDEPSGPSPRYAATKDSVAICIFKGLKLVARGRIVDVVDGLAGSRNTKLVQCSAQVNLTEVASGCISASEILRSVCKSLVLDRKDRFMRIAMPADEFFYDFMWLCSQLMVGSVSLVTKEFQEWYDYTTSILIQGRSFENVLRDSNEAIGVGLSSSAPNQDEYIFDSFFGRFFDTVMRMSLRLMVTRNGRIGMVSEKASKGDLVCVLLGCSVPVLLRQSGGEGEGTFKLVGECFLDGFMDGAGLGGDACPERDFCIE
ncbi:heterokaryon incompatibility protein-domain-containing protein [Xylaria bambusicola]|uniref:heterokaryon incompatibility protein-domain-containing protein n=1 Tax=Xylaria bambusicola TaxID=326684 RepID=UPI002008BA59|nr:heterokaryon incompatibility protein-domain-containing protein [Xylaria bambusicola]KAI0514646.1 heterokaryon incompatibility protein-domain-containing protein [Xylaria bambusicola]